MGQTVLKVGQNIAQSVSLSGWVMCSTLQMVTQFLSNLVLKYITTTKSNCDSHSLLLHTKTILTYAFPRTNSGW